MKNSESPSGSGDSGLRGDEVLGVNDGSINEAAEKVLNGVVRSNRGIAENAGIKENGRCGANSGDKFLVGVERNNSVDDAGVVQEVLGAGLPAGENDNIEVIGNEIINRVVGGERDIM